MIAPSAPSRFALPLKVLSFFAIFLAIFTLFATQLFYRDPTSLFFRPLAASQQDYSAFREAQAFEYIEKAKLGPQPKTSNESTPELCVGVATVAREGARYFRYAVGSLLHGLTEEERSKFHLILFVAHSDPRRHPAWGEKWMGNVADTMLGYEFSGNLEQHLKEMEIEKGLFREKGVLDYTHLMKACRATNASYILMLEDDIVAQDGWMHRTLNALKVTEEKTRALGRERFLYLRLFYTETYFGWNSEEWQVYLTNSLKVFGAVCAILFVCRLSFKSDPIISRYLTLEMVLVYLFVLTPVCIVFIFAAGRVSLFPLPQGVHLMPEFGCCSQALAFPHNRTYDVAAYLEERKVGFVDVMIEEYARSRGELQWALTPSIFQHVGARSSKDDQGTVTQWIFNYNYEQQDAESLRREHEYALKKQQV